MKATWILILFIVGQSEAITIGGVAGRIGCVGQLSLYQGDSILEQIE